MRKVVVISLILMAFLAGGIIGCNGGSGGPIKTKAVTAFVAGDSVSVSASEVQNSKNTNFAVKAKGVVTTYMAYTLGNEIYVRANICPPCQSTGFTLNKSVLVCDNCATKFEAQTGKGISGACVNYPKAAVPYEVIGGNIVMKVDNLIASYTDTLKPGLP